MSRPWGNKKAAGIIPAARVKLVKTLQPDTQEHAPVAKRIAPEARYAKLAVVVHFFLKINKPGKFVNALSARVRGSGGLSAFYKKQNSGPRGPELLCTYET